MTILAKNLKTLRRNLGCTQTVISKGLGIGFRTYVRYEAGERDAPIATLIKFARFGNLSLDRLLTTELTLDDFKVPDEDIPPAMAANIPVIGGNLESGRLMFKGIKHDYLVSAQPLEKTLLEIFRKVDRSTKEKILQDVESRSKKYIKAKKRDSAPKKALKKENALRLKKAAKTFKKITCKG